ncbi:hypothetical protein PR202_gb04600 [Eleusine coracana subsp. coracana]|uniref:Tyrosinase copper-binding domain-containing protein n=1 Tax=Eleusine coracana subsp. coracana TaxID=191504 RepID=A0AAV5E4Y4_ELECO|nr:hypothetical protein PR202_gb04600 [Eleusine coracana subsp. coracana]
MAGSNCALQSLRILVLCALAAAATTIAPRAMSPCAYSMSRTILAVTGVDPYFITCAGDASLSDDGADDAGKKPGSGGPVVTDLRWCGKPDPLKHPTPPFQCCQPMTTSEPVNFTFPDPAEPLRTRRPAHEAGSDHMAKYRRAVALMKALPRSDPRSFYQQANLLGDPGFVLPFWSWDVPEGMRIPDEFTDRASPLYDARRNPRHLPPKVNDLEFLDAESNYTDEQQVQRNLWVMHKQMVTNARLPSLFLGQPYHAGDKAMPGAGTVELCPHNTMHLWAGDISNPNVEDMGVYYSAGRDPIFYPHHANIDRLWDAWRHIMRTTHGNQTQVDFTDPDWLDSSLLFYDEDLTVEVTRPHPPRSRQEEVLVVEGIEANNSDYVKFDVYVNSMEYHKVRPGGRELARTFVTLKQPGGERDTMKTSMRVALSELLEDLGAEGDDSVTVTLVPVRGKVRIGGLRIEYVAE